VTSGSATVLAGGRFLAAFAQHEEQAYGRNGTKNHGHGDPFFSCSLIVLPHIE
jgi:hypothetical protein